LIGIRGFIHALAPAAPIRVDINQNFTGFGFVQLVSLFNAYPVDFNRFFLRKYGNSQEGKKEDCKFFHKAKIKKWNDVIDVPLLKPFSG
jgi:hypothetical protein